MTNDFKTNIIRGDGFDLSFANFLAIKTDNKELAEHLNSIIYTKRCSVGETDNSYRVINHWTSIGLIDDTRDDSGKWRKFNLMEMIWITIIKKLRDFGLSNEKILLVKSALFEKQPDYNKAVFEYYIAEAMLKSFEVSCIVFGNGNADFVDENDLNLAKIFIIGSDYIIVSITSIIESITKRQISRDNPSFVALSEKEIELLLKTIDGGDMEVKTKIKEGKMKEFTISHPRRRQIADIKNTNINNLIKTNPNAKIIISTNDNAKATGIVIETSV